MSRKIQFIYNPASRSGKSKAIADRTVEFFKETGIDFDFVETAAPRDGIEKAIQAKNSGYDTVVSIGGDGTAHEVANGAIKAGITFGMIPAGSGNDFAKAVGINGIWEDAVETLLHGKPQKVSVVQAGDRYSINVVEAGLGGDVARRSENSLRWMSGSKKYTFLMLRELLVHKPYPCQIVVDGEIYEYNINLIAAGFGQSFGSGMLVLPDARFNKDKMRVAVVHSANRLTILRVFPKVFSGKHVHYTKYVTMFDAKEIEIVPQTQKTMVSQAEGEVIGNPPMKWTARPNSLEVIIPEDWSLDNQSLWV